jgi:hypothetical protein
MLRKIILLGLVALISLSLIGQAAAEGGAAGGAAGAAGAGFGASGFGGGASGISSTSTGFGTFGGSELGRGLGSGFASFDFAAGSGGPGFGNPVVPVSIFGEYGMFGPGDIFGPLGLFGWSGLYGPQAITFPNVFIAGWWNGYC